MLGIRLLRTQEFRMMEFKIRLGMVAQNPRVQNDGIQNQIGNGNLVAVRAEGNAAGHNGNQIRCYNCKGVGHFARDCTVAQNPRVQNDGIQNQIGNVSDQKDNTQDSSKNTKFAKQPNVGILSKIGETNTLSKPVTSNSVSTPQVSKGVNNAKVIASGMFRISPDKISREAKKVPNTVSVSARTKPTTVSRPSVINKKKVNSDLNGVSSIGVDNTTKTRRTQLKRSSKNNTVPYVVKSSYKKNKAADVEESHRNLLSSSNKKHVSSACNNFMLDSQNVYSKVGCAMSRAEGIYPGTLPLDRVEVLVMNGNPSRVNIKQLYGRGTITLSWNPVTKVLLKLILSVHRIRRRRYYLIPAELKFKTSHARSSR
nr:hypothetical protein [Tanacetum cinerariifolium]